MMHVPDSPLVWWVAMACILGGVAAAFAVVVLWVSTYGEEQQ